MNVNRNTLITLILKHIFFFPKILKKTLDIFQTNVDFQVINHFLFYFPAFVFVVDFDQSCGDYNSYTIYDDDTYYIRWKGATSKLYSPCSYKFSPFDTDYKVCVEAESLFISDCSVKLQYYGGLIGTLLERVK